MCLVPISPTKAPGAYIQVPPFKPLSDCPSLPWAFQDVLITATHLQRMHRHTLAASLPPTLCSTQPSPQPFSHLLLLLLRGLLTPGLLVGPGAVHMTHRCLQQTLTRGETITRARQNALCCNCGCDWLLGQLRWGTLSQLRHVWRLCGRIRSGDNEGLFILNLGCIIARHQVCMHDIQQASPGQAMWVGAQACPGENILYVCAACGVLPVGVTHWECTACKGPACAGDALPS